MKKRTLPAKILSTVLSVAMVASLLPSTAFGATFSDDYKTVIGETTTEAISAIADGTYSGTAECNADEDLEFWDYDLVVSVTVKDGKITAVEKDDENTTAMDENDKYIDYAFEGRTTKGVTYTSVPDQIITSQSTESIDIVSGATCTSLAIVEAVDDALANATAVDSEDPETETPEAETPETETPEADTSEEETPEADDDTVVYVTMNIPYEDFFTTIDSDVQQSYEYTSAYYASADFDTLSYATSKYGISSAGRSTSGTSAGTYNDGTYVKGYYYAVQMSASDYEAFVAANAELTEGDDYYVTALEEAPNAYLVATYNETANTLSFNASKLLSNTTTFAGVIDEVSYTTTYGDYQFSLMNINQYGQSTLNIEVDDETIDITIAAEIVNFSDGSSLAIYPVDNNWYGSRYNHEISWCVVGGRGLYKGHNSSSNPLVYQYTMTDYTMTSVTVVTDQGIFEYTCNYEWLPYYSGDELSVEAENGDTEVSVTVPDAFENVEVSVYYSVTSGRSSTAVYVAEAAQVVDGKVTLTEAIDCGTNGTYTILVESSNYAPITITLEVLMSDAQTEELETLVATATALLAVADHSTLSAHVAEAEELLADEDATYSEAAELIEEMSGYVTELTATVEALDAVYVTINIPFEVFYNAVAGDAEQAYEYTAEYYASDDFDTLSYATSKYGVDGTGKRNTSGTSKGTYTDGTYMKGIYYAVQVDGETYVALVAASTDLTAGDDYYFDGATVEAPASYMLLTYADGAYTFDASTITDAGTEEANIDEVTYSSTYGDYMFELINVDNGKTNTDIGTTNINGEAVTIVGEILTFSDESSIALYNVDNIWMGTRYNHQIAWSVVGGKGYYKGHNSSSNPLYYQYTMTDYTLTSITVITDQGTYTYTCEYDFLQYYDGDEEVVVEAESGDEEVSVTVPDGMEDVTVSVYYSVTSGRSSTAVYVAEDATIVDGKVTLTEAIDCDTNGTYTIVIESSNYAPITYTIEVPMTTTQTETMNSLVEEATALLEEMEALGISASQLAEHVAEALELLANEETTYSEAAELIEEISGYIAEFTATIESLEAVYVTINIPFEVFYNAVAGDAEQAYEYTAAYYASDDFDTLSYATSKYGVGSGGKRNTSGTSKGTYTDGTYMKGIYYAVQIDGATYIALMEASTNLTEGDDYYFDGATATAPASYMMMTYADGEYTFDASTITDAGTEEADIDAVTYSSTYGDYMFELMNVDNGKTNTDIGTTNIGGEAVTIVGEVLTFSDGSSIALYNVDNIWMGSRYNHQIAWSVVGGKGYYKGHNSSSNPLYYQYTMTDYTLTSITVITDQGTYTYTCEYDFLQYYNGDEEIVVEAADGDTEVSVTVPDSFENVEVSVYYSVTSGRSSTAVYVAEAAQVVDGKVTLTEAIDCGTNGTYTILVESSNYAPITITLEVLMSDAQTEELETLVATATALLAVADHSTLSAHVAEAEELLADEDATYSEAAELIEEMSGYVTELAAIVETLEAVYVTINIPFEVFYNAVAGDAEQAYEYTAAYYASDDFDTLSYATSKYGVDSAGRSTSGTSKGTYSDGTYMKGIYYAVQVDGETYVALVAASIALTEGDDYYFDGATVEAPASYMLLTYADGAYTFDASTITDAGTEEANIDEVTYSSTYGDYMFELINVDNGKTNTDIGTTNINGEAVTIVGEILTFSDGSSIALYNVDNIWMGSRYNHQIAWSVVGGKGYYKGHNSSSNPLYYQYTMTDYTLVSITVITDQGTYTYTCNYTFLEYYDGDEEVVVEAESGDEEVSVTVPEELEDVTVSVYYSVTSGRSTTAVYVATEATIVDGKVILEEAIDCDTNGTYTIVIESSNYAPITYTIEVPMTTTQTETMNSLVEEATALLEEMEALGISTSQLAEHVAEALELLANEETTYSEAAELIAELYTLIDAAKESVEEATAEETPDTDSEEEEEADTTPTTEATDTSKTETQVETLSSLVEEATALIEEMKALGIDSSELAAYVAEVEALLANEEVTASEAAALIEALNELVESAKEAIEEENSDADTEDSDADTEDSDAENSTIESSSDATSTDDSDTSDNSLFGLYLAVACAAALALFAAKRRREYER